MSLELNEEIDIKSETIEELDFMSNEIDIKNEAFEEQDEEFESKGTSGHIATLSGNNTDIEVDVDPVDIGGEAATTSLLTNSIPEYSYTCQICNKGYGLKNNLRNHLKYEHKVVVDIEPLIKCLIKCFVCYKTFASQCSLSVHILSHTEKLHPLFGVEEENTWKFACKLCGVKHNSNAKVVQHIKSVHLGLKKFKCKVCSAYFIVKSNLFEHFCYRHSSKEPYSCVLCSYKCLGRMNLRSHMLAKHKLDGNSVASLLPPVKDYRKYLNCKVCDVEFNSRCEFRKHVSDVHEGADEFKCPVCQEDFRCIVTLIAHLFNHHATSQVQNNGYESNGTSGHSKTLSDNETDIKIEKRPDEICREVTTSMLTHKKTVIGTFFTGKICSKRFSVRSHLTQHLTKVHEVDSPIARLTCLECHEIFTTQYDLCVHLLSHAEILHPLLSSEKKSSYKYICKICGMILKSSKEKVIQHIKFVHFGLKEYKCKVCSTYFTQQEDLIEHFSLQHSLMEHFTCVVCSYKCFFRGNLKKHLLSYHKLGKNSVASLLPADSSCKSPLICKVCKVVFRSSDKFYQHVSDVHDSLDEIKCPVCHKNFTCIVTLIGHLHAHGVTKQKQNNELESNKKSGDCTNLSGNETDIKIEVDPVEIGGEVTTSLLTKPVSGIYFTCKICSEQFKSLSYLSKHLRCVHNFELVEKCFKKCFVCKKEFAKQCNLSNHLLCHAEILHPLFSSEKIDSNTYECKVCGVTKTSSIYVIQHVKSVHLGLKEYKCKVCNTYFIKKSALMTHFSLQHSLIERFSCERCSFKCFKKCQLKRHLLEKHNLDENSVAALLVASSLSVTSLNCKVCDVKFKSRGDFHKHISDVHVGLLKIICPVCQKNYTCIVKLINHLHDHGVSDQPFSCGMCEEWFSTENDRSTHLVNFHNKSPDGSSGSSSYECDTCKKVYISTDQVKEHILEHLNSNSLSCFKYDMFSSFDYLKEHNYCSYPSEDSSVISSVCKETFRSVQSLKIHSANMHENTFETSQFDNTELLVSPDTKIGIVRCEICKQDFDNPTSLMDHFIKIHKNNKKQTSLLKNKRECQKVSQREHRTAEYLKNRLGSSAVKPQLQQTMVRPDCKSTDNSQAEIWITKVKPCCVLLDRGEVTRYLARLDKREEGTEESSPIEDLPPPLATPPVRVYPSHPCGRVGVTSDHLLSAATSNVGLVEGRKVTFDCKSTGNSLAEIWITKVKPCCVMLDRGEVTRYLARLDKREEGTVGSSPIEDLPPPLATPPVRVDPSHPCGRVGVTSDRLLSAATSNVGLVCNNIGPRTVVEPKQLCVVNSGDGEASSNNCIKSANLASQQLGNFEEIYMISEPYFQADSDFGDPLSC